MPYCHDFSSLPSSLFVKSPAVRINIISTAWIVSTSQSFTFAVDWVVPLLSTKWILAVLGLLPNWIALSVPTRGPPPNNCNPPSSSSCWLSTSLSWSSLSLCMKSPHSSTQMRPTSLCYINGPNTLLHLTQHRFDHMTFGLATGQICPVIIRFHGLLRLFKYCKKRLMTSDT